MINNLKDLKKLIALCRTTGIDAIEIGEIKISLGTDPQKYTQRKVLKTQDISPDSPSFLPGGDLAEHPVIATDDFDSLTDEQKLFYSVQPPVGSNEQPQ